MASADLKLARILGFEDDDDPREWRSTYRGDPPKRHIVRGPNVPDSWGWRGAVYVARMNAGENPTYCGLDANKMAVVRMTDSAFDRFDPCVNCLKGYHADEDAE